MSEAANKYIPIVFTAFLGIITLLQGFQLYSNQGLSSNIEDLQKDIFNLKLELGTISASRVKPEHINALWQAVYATQRDVAVLQNTQLRNNNESPKQNTDHSP